jgi:hypothetical protein
MSMPRPEFEGVVRFQIAEVFQRIPSVILENLRAFLLRLRILHQIAGQRRVIEHAGKDYVGQLPRRDILPDHLVVRAGTGYNESDILP